MPILVVLWFSKANHSEASATITIERMVAHNSNIKLHHFSKKNKEILLRSWIPIQLKSKIIRRAFVEYNIDAIFYPHDFVGGQIVQAFFHALNKSSRICFGDAYGLIYSEDHFLRAFYRYPSIGQYASSPIISALTAARILLKKTVASRIFSRLLPDEIIAPIPVDMSYSAERSLNEKYTIVELEKVLWVVKVISDGYYDKSFHPSRIRKKGEMVLLIGSFSEAGLMLYEREVELYIKSVIRICRPCNPITIKPHSASSPTKTSHIRDLLEKLGFKVSVIDQEVPIEISEYNCAAESYISYSYSSVTLSYLYAARIHHALNKQIINQYFFLDFQDWIQEGNELYIDIVKSLGGDLHLIDSLEQ